LLVRDLGGRRDEERALLGRLPTTCLPAATASPLLRDIVRTVREQLPERLDG
jgi:hypothetical protein